jgi:purine-binding chemotaxis protein CheW
VDDVQEVTQITGGEIEAAPSFGTQVDTDFILGIAKLKSRVAILLDIDKALAEESSVPVPALA